MSPPPAKAPDKPAKKTPAKKAAAKAAKASKKAAAKKAGAKKAPAKKAAAKKAPAKKAEPGAAKPLIQPPPTPPRIETNGQLAAAAKDAAAHAKSTVDAARNPVSGDAGLSSAGRSPVPLAVAIVISLLALLLVRQLRQRGANRDE
ncbi:MAG: nucleoid-structuring protein H-NS [Mycobacterium sp.]|uniref:Rv3852 family protein n=1 Tax=Mycobacterium sp. TaxID=1785 RepID=UPI003C39F2C2